MHWITPYSREKWSRDLPDIRTAQNRLWNYDDTVLVVGNQHV